MHDAEKLKHDIEILRQRFVDRAALDANALDLALTHFEAGRPTAEQISGLRRDAHRLVGGLGMFNFVDAGAEAQLFTDLLAQANVDSNVIISKGRALTDMLRTLSTRISPCCAPASRSESPATGILCSADTSDR